MIHPGGVHSLSALVVAHPGHELNLHRWLELTSPQVFVLTDGSGSSGQSRLSSTTRILSRTGAKPGAIYGRFSDRDVYRALVERDFKLFTELCDDLVHALGEQGIETIVGDAAEGYNPTHDVCRLLVNAAVRVLERPGGSAIQNFDFSLTGPQGACPPALRDRATWIHLDDAAVARKIEAARGFAELRDEVEARLRISGAEQLQLECLRPVDDRTGSYRLADVPPFYERHGEKRVAEGQYAHVIRYGEHVLPLAEALRRWVDDTRP